MIRLHAVKALFEKECVQLRWMAVLSFCLMGLTPLFGSLLYWLDRPNRSRPWGDWSLHAENIFTRGEGSTFVYLGIVLALILGVRVFANDRADQSNLFLASLPVSKSEIALAKYLAGTAVIQGIAFVHILFFTVMPLFLPAYYSLTGAVCWFLLAGGLLQLVFSIGFLAGSISHRRLGAYETAFLLLLLPSILSKMTEPYSPVFSTGMAVFSPIHAALELSGLVERHAGLSVMVFFLCAGVLGLLSALAIERGWPQGTGSRRLLSAGSKREGDR
ncbi:ABC-2 transporter permease [Brevibacillus ruminantium]|uniref:ABC-2 transporter permease n=1 Tax=Brevibacillus ruminantium TaxID=2950604 RepID=A0ABY4WD44_9BACL|nr:ABC-2 transporter permease [Brevibacillus ruminantium]USG64073.1 ABC-2 transporter permease [Brevibacillus ruminantium]